MSILVLGMHRSGTSALGRVLSRLGYYLGPEEQIMPPKPDNPAGFWERRDIRDINDQILKAVNASWDCPPEKPLAKKALPADALEAINSTVVRMESRHPFFIKDPRLSFTARFWLDNIQDCLAIIAVRNPLEVARSLLNRNGLPIELGLALWEAYTNAAFKQVKRVPFHVYSYNNLIEDPEREVGSLLAFLSKYGSIPNAHSSQFVASLIQQDLKTASASEGELQENHADYAERYRSFTRQGREKGAAPPLSAATKCALMMYRCVSRPLKSVQLAERLNAAAAENAVLTEREKKQSEEVSRLGSEASRLNKDLASLQNVLKEREKKQSEEVSSLGSEVSRLNKDLASLRNALKERETELQQAEGQLAERQEALSSEIARRLELEKKANKERASVETKLARSAAENAQLTRRLHLSEFEKSILELSLSAFQPSESADPAIVEKVATLNREIHGVFAAWAEDEASLRDFVFSLAAGLVESVLATSKLKLRSDHARQEAELSRTQHEQALAEAKRALTDARARLDRTDETIQQLRDEREVARHFISSLEEGQRASASELDSQTAEVRRLKKKFHDGLWIHAYYFFRNLLPRSR